VTLISRRLWSVLAGTVRCRSRLPPSLVIAVLGSAVLWVVAAAAAGELARDVGLRADYKLIFMRPLYLTYYVANASAFCWLGFVLIHQEWVRSKAPLLAAVFAMSLELLIVGLVRLEVTYWLYVVIDTAWYILWLPGEWLQWLLVGRSFCRWCDGLVDAPVRLVLLEAGTMGCLNGLGWYWLTVLVLSLKRRGAR
jgi:hypothetical protein